MKKTLVALLLALCMMAGMLTVTAGAAEEDASADTGYVQDGLVLQLDANDNTGTGTHDDETIEIGAVPCNDGTGHEGAH